MTRFYKLRALTEYLNLQLRLHKADNPVFHAHVFKQYMGYDWLDYIRHEKNLPFSLLISSTSRRDVMLVSIEPQVVYPLKQVETIRLLEGTVFLDFNHPVFDKFSAGNVDTSTFIVGKQEFLHNGCDKTTFLCMINREL